MRSHRSRRPSLRSARAIEARVSWMTAERAGLRRERNRPGTHHRQRGPLRLLSVQQVEHGAGAEPGRAHPQPGVPGRVGESPVVGGAGEDAEPAAGVDHPAPRVRELESGQLRKGLEEVLGQPGERGRVRIARGADAAAVVVDRVEATPQDPVVGGQPVVVELVPGVGEALPVPPSDAGQLGGRQRLGHQRVVVHRHEVVPEPAQQRPVAAGAERHPARQHGAVPGEDPQPGPALAGHACHRGVLVDAHPGSQAGPAQPPGQPGRVKHEARVAVPHPAQVGGRGDLAPDLRGVQHLHVVAERACRLGVGAQPADLPGRHRHHQLAGPLGRAVDPVTGDGVGDLVQVRHAEPVELPRSRPGTGPGRCPARGSGSPRRSRRCGRTRPNRLTGPPAAPRRLPGCAPWPAGRSIAR